MKRHLVLVAAVAFSLTQTGCVSTLLSVATGHGLNWGSDSSGDSSGYYDNDDSAARASDEANRQMQSWLTQQQVQQQQDMANQMTNQASMDAANAAAASAASNSAPLVNP